MDLDYGFAYTSFTIPFLANVKFVLNPAFDNLNTNDIENPLIDGRPLSSFSFIIFSGSTKMVLWTTWEELKDLHLLDSSMDIEFI